MRYKRYGIQFLYPNGFGEIPNIVLRAFDIIENIIDKNEIDSIKATKENNTKKKTNK